MAIREFRYQLPGTTRGPLDWIVYPSKRDKPVVVQSDRAIGTFDRSTGRGVLNWRGSNAKYFVHLSRALGAQPYQFPDAFRLMALELMPNSGDLIGTSPETGPVYIA